MQSALGCWVLAITTISVSKTVRAKQDIHPPWESKQVKLALKQDKSRKFVISSLFLIFVLGFTLKQKFYFYAVLTLFPCLKMMLDSTGEKSLGFFVFLVQSIQITVLERQIFHEACTGIFQWQPSEGLQLQCSLSEPQPKLFCYQCKLLTYFSRWKRWYNEIAMNAGDHSNPRNQRTFFSFHSAQALQLRDGGRQRASPPLFKSTQTPTDWQQNR